MKLLKINQKIGTLRVLVSYLNPMALVFDNAMIPLDKQCNGGDLIEISVNKSSYLAYWKTKL